jgi:hypothetical protein
MIANRASVDSSGIVGEGLGISLGLTVTVAEGLALAFADGFALAFGVGLPVAPPLTT